ncbi:MAG: Holliday junction resolvase RuvX [Acidobacteriia bacterium]|nr:Holliday junction resolvase RuvX [Terriglobia bacterium]
MTNKGAPQARPGRVLALDVGKKRIGLALSDELGLTAQGLETLQRTRVREDVERLRELAEGKGATMLLIGYPLQMNGVEGRQVRWVREFGDMITKRTGLAVEYWDERLTSVEANRVLRSSGISIAKRGAAVDRLSAVILLDSFLERQRLERLRQAEQPEE